MNLSLRNIIIGIIVLVLAVAIPITIRLAQQQQLLKSKAAGTAHVTFPDAVACSQPSGICATNQTIQIQVTSPF